MIHAKSRPLITYLHVRNGFIRLYLKQDTDVRGYPVWSSLFNILYIMVRPFSPPAEGVGCASAETIRQYNYELWVFVQTHYYYIMCVFIANLQSYNKQIQGVFRIYDILLLFKRYFSVITFKQNRCTRLFSERAHPRLMSSQV